MSPLTAVSPRLTALSCFAAIILFGSPLVWADGMAVSGLNGKVSLSGGEMNSQSAALLDGVITVPVGQSFGLQVDIANGHLVQNSYEGYGGHFFWRSPSEGMIGLTSSHQTFGGNANLGRDGIEAERYFQELTIGLRVGHQTGSTTNGSYGSLGVRWYSTRNLALSIGHDESPGGVTATGIGFEWQPESILGSSNVSFFGHVDESSGSNSAVMFGIRYYFDDKKSLIQRHRTADPDTLLMGGGYLNTQLPVRPAPPACVLPRRVFHGICQMPVD